MKLSAWEKEQDLRMAAEEECDRLREALREEQVRRRELEDVLLRSAPEHIDHGQVWPGLIECMRCHVDDVLARTRETAEEESR